MIRNIFLRKNGDITLKNRLRVITRHYWQKLKANTLGRLFISNFGRRVRSFIASTFHSTPRPKIDIAITAHIYYLEIAHEIVDLRNILAETIPIYLTVPFDRADDLSRLVGNLPGVFVYPCENRGRDIAPFFTLLQSGSLDRFDAVLKLHSKRSPHLIDGDLRRKLLFTMLCGERYATYRMLKAFERPDTGLVGWGDSYRTDPVFWMANKERVDAISERIGASQAMRLGFFEGSMFWFRPKALDVLRRLDLTSDSFETEAGQLDGTLHHALERCFSIAAWASGYTVRDLRGREL